ncbi:MAG: hypothetical protein B6I36_09570 [Desulfobacteraceae bacterium 4572_35.1]|nr:MAG: hypothetical protein B6I36_09570 [Desulfobacteraceae bacterium 4572_35.1]
MAKLNLAAQIKKRLNDTAKFDHHPLQTMADEHKVNYLKALSLMIYADQTRNEDEAEYFGKLFRTLNPSAITLEELYSFAENPKFDDIDGLKRTLSMQEQTGHSFLFDFVMLAAADGEISTDEKALIAVSRGLLGWDQDKLNQWYRISEQVAADPIDVIERFRKNFPCKVIDHILQHRGLKRTKADAVSTKTFSVPSNIGFVAGMYSKLETLEVYLPPVHKTSMACKLKDALNEVLVLRSHPLQDADLEDKMNYLKVLSFVLMADEQIATEEVSYFGAIIRTLVDKSMVQVLLAYAANPDLTELPAITATLEKSEDYKICLILDAAMVAYADGDFNSDEDELIRQLREIIGWGHGQFGNAFDIAKKVAEATAEGTLNRLILEIPKGLAIHILEYKGMSPLHKGTVDYEVYAEYKRGLSSSQAILDDSDPWAS